jgi:hypothetical protein
MIDEYEEDFIKNTHPSFTIICDKCGSNKVRVDNDMGWSRESGEWGSVDLVCCNPDCNNYTTIVES